MKKYNVRSEVEQHIQMTEKALKAFPWTDREAYALWVAQTYYFVQHSTRLIALAAARSGFDVPEIHNRFLQHVGEEKGHEKLCLLDLKSLGKDIKDLPEMPATASMYQTQYYWTEHENGPSFLGYVLALETLAARFGGDIKVRLEKEFGPKAAHFMRVHAEEDVAHVDQALEKIESLPPQYQASVMKNLQNSFTYYAQMLDQCAAFAKSEKRHAA